MSSISSAPSLIADQRGNTLGMLLFSGRIYFEAERCVEMSVDNLITRCKSTIPLNSVAEQ
jgi:hypothetical protein